MSTTWSRLPSRRRLALAILGLMLATTLAACGGDAEVLSIPGPTATASAGVSTPTPGSNADN